MSVLKVYNKNIKGVICMTYQKDFTTTYTIAGHKYTVTAPALFDSVTNEIVPDNKLDDQAAEIARQQYRNEMGLVSPTAIKEFCTKNKLSQRDLAKLTGLSLNTIALYEAGEFPTKTNNKILKSLMHNYNTYF